MDSKNKSRTNGLVLQGDILNSKQEAAALLEWTSNFLLLDERRDEVNEFDHNPCNQNHPIRKERSPPVLNPHFNHPILPPTPLSTPPSSPPPSPPPPLSPPPPPHPPPQRHPVLCMTNDDKPRLRWTPELHEHFVACAAQLGGPFGATPKHIMRKMNVDGLTILHVKSHLQKYRTTMLMESNELAHTPSPFQRHQSTPYEEPAVQSTAEGTEMFPGQLPMQDSQFSQSQVQMSLQIQEEAQEKYLKSLMKRAYDFCAPQTTQRTSFKHQKCENSSQVPFPSPRCMSTEQSDMQSYYCQLQRSLHIEEGQDKYLMQQGYDIGRPQTTNAGSLKCSKSENFSQVPFPTLPRISAEQTDRQSNIEQLKSLLPAMEAYNTSSKNAEVKTTLPSGSPLHNNQNSPCVLRDSFPGSSSLLFGLWPEVDHYSFDEIDPQVLASCQMDSYYSGQIQVPENADSSLLQL